MDIVSEHILTRARLPLEQDHAGHRRSPLHILHQLLHHAAPVDQLQFLALHLDFRSVVLLAFPQNQLVALL